jgi:hypothetical protein
VGAAIEDEVLTRRGLLKADRLTELAGHIGWNGAAGSQDFWRQRGDGDHEKEKTAENAKNAENDFQKALCALRDLPGFFFVSIVRFRGSL